MADLHLITTLQRKRNQIENAIATYEKKIEAARIDLAHVYATLAMFKASEGRTEFPVYMDTLRLFKRGELVILCRTALENGSKDTRELAIAVIKAKGMDSNDAILRRSIAFRIVHSLRLLAKSGKLESLPKRKGVRVWKLPES